MIADLKPYEEYKESGVEWLGNMPEHWGVRRFKRVVDQSRPITYGIVQCGDHVPEGIPYIRPVDMREDGSVSLNKLKRTSRTIAASYRRSEVHGGDVVVSIGPSFGKVMVVPDALNGANLTQGTARIAPGQAISAEFLLWLVRSKAMHHSMAAVATGSTFLALNLEPLGRIRVPLPPPDEQAAIVRFLNWANGRLVRAFEAKRRVIALLNEHKQATIHRAVTRGLDPSVNLKPSGIPWLGDIPQHWEVRQLGRFITLQRGFDITKTQQVPGQIPVVSSGGISSFHNKATSPGPGVILGRKGSVGALHFIEGPYWAHDTTLWVRDFGGNHPRMVYYLFSLLHLKRFDTGSSNPTLNRNLVHPELVCLPPIKEQESIAEFLDNFVSKTERSVLRLEREIELLREYRTRLVSDVVTGKLDVREASALLPDEALIDTVEDDLGDETGAADEQATE